jgi:hypothetical protein
VGDCKECLTKLRECSRRCNIVYRGVDEKPEGSSKLLKRLVGERGFEPPTPTREQRGILRQRYSATATRFSSLSHRHPRGSDAPQKRAAASPTTVGLTGCASGCHARTVGSKTDHRCLFRNCSYSRWIMTDIPCLDSREGVDRLALTVNAPRSERRKGGRDSTVTA